MSIMIHKDGQDVRFGDASIPRDECMLDIQARINCPTRKRQG